MATSGQPGVIEQMLVSAGFAPRERGTVTVTSEWPDARLAVRALAAAGPSVPAIQAAGFGWITAELRPQDR
jgi:hypothetical protein